MNHRIARTVFALGFGLLAATFAYQWISNPAGREERAIQVSVVEASRRHLQAVIDAGPLEIVDPVSPNRKVGKVYIYPAGEGWEVSGYYRRGVDDAWHPYLISLSADQGLIRLKTGDGAEELIERAAVDPQLEISP